MARIRQDDITTLREKDLIPVVKIGISSIIGTREEQQDTVFELYKEPYYIAAVCDGMGGLCGGEVASRTAVEFLVQDFQSLGAEEDPTVFLKREAVKLDEAVCQLTGEDGEPLEAGTTIVAAMIRSGKFYWMSVGDSRIFYITRNRIFSITREHNYRLTLDILKKRGKFQKKNTE